MGVSSGQRVARRRNTSARNFRSIFETRLAGFAISTYVDRGCSAAMEPAASPTRMNAPIRTFTLPRGLEVGRRLDGEEGPIRRQDAQGPVAVQAGGKSGGPVHVVSLELDQPVCVDVEAEGERGVELPALRASSLAGVWKEQGIIGPGLKPGIQAIRRQGVGSLAERQALREH